MSHVDAAAFRDAHTKGSGSQSPFLLWRQRPAGLDVRGIGPQFSVETHVDITEPDGTQFDIAVPTGLALAWLGGLKGDVEYEYVESESLLRLASAASAIEIEVATEGDILIRLLNMDQPTGDLTPLGFGREIWEAMDAVAWASGAKIGSTVDDRMKAVHVNGGQVFAVSGGNLAVVHLDGAGDVPAMIPSALAMMAKQINTEDALVFVDSANRLHVLDADSRFIAPLIGGEQIGDKTAHPRLQEVKANGKDTTFSAKALKDALQRLDRVDLDETAKGTDVKARMRLAAVDDSTLGLSVLVGKRKATEAIPFDGEPIALVVSMSYFRALVGFALSDLGDEITLRTIDKLHPVYLSSGNREAWIMPNAEAKL